MKKYFIAFLIISSCSCFAQQLEWVKSFEGNDMDESYAIKTDASGNVYSVGIFRGNVDFNPGPAVYNYSCAPGYSNVFISKLDVNGDFVWAKRIASTNNISASSIDIDAAGNLYVLGGFMGTVDFDPGPSTYTMAAATPTGSSYSDLFILKLNSSGNFVQAWKFGGTSLNFSSGEHQIRIDNGGNMIISGSFRNTVDFNPGSGTFNITASASSGTLFSNLFVLKLNSAGAFVWAKSVSGANDVKIGRKALDVDGSSNIYLCGRYIGIGDFDPGTSTYTLASTTATNSLASNAFIFKLDPNGVFSWAKSINSTGHSSCNSLTIDNTGNVYTTGEFSGTADLDPGIPVFNYTSSTSDIFILKMTSAGAYTWVKRIGNSQSLSFSFVDADAFGDIVYTGVFTGTVDFDPNGGVYNLTCSSGQNIFVSRLSSAGGFKWARALEGSTSSFPQGIDWNTIFNKIHIIGDFAATTDFDLGTNSFYLTPLGYRDVFIQKLRPCQNTTSNISPVVCSSYTSPSGKTYTMSGIYKDTLINSSGCDSIIDINLTVNIPSAFAFTTNSMVASFSITSSGCNTFLWDFGNGNTSSINPNPVITYASPGTYGVCLQCNGQPNNCVKCYNITVPSNTAIGVMELEEINGISFFPNPTSGIFNLKSDHLLENPSIKVFNTQGQIIYESTRFINELDLSNQPKGIYLLQVKTNKGVSTQKIIIQ